MSTMKTTNRCFRLEQFIFYVDRVYLFHGCCAFSSNLRLLSKESLGLFILCRVFSRAHI